MKVSSVLVAATLSFALITPTATAQPTPTSGVPPAGPLSASSSPADRATPSRQGFPGEARPGGAGVSVPGFVVTDPVVSNSTPGLTIGGSEPSIAVDPNNTNHITISSFAGGWGATAPLWNSTDGGQNWSFDQAIPAPPGVSNGGCPCDQTYDYAQDGRLYGSILVENATESAVYTGSTSDPTSSASWAWNVVGGVAQKTNQAAAGCAFCVDQPWMRIGKNPSNLAQDNVYGAYDNLTFTSQVSVAPAANPPVFTLANDKTAATDSNCNVNTCVNPGLRLAVDDSNGTVYALWQQITPASVADPATVNFKLNRSTDGGQTWTLNGSSDGMVVATADSTQPTPKFGTVNALLGGVDSAAVDPLTHDVYYVHGKRDASGNNHLRVVRLHDFGGTLTEVSNTSLTGTATEQLALPSIAVTQNGTVGVMYTSYDGIVSGFPQFTTRLARSGDHGASFQLSTIQTYASPSTDNGDSRQRVLGDYEQMKTVGDTFYGVYSGNRTGFAGATSAIDPIFFKTSALPGAPTGVTAVPGNALATVSWTAPASNGGSPITGYTVTAVEDNTKTCTWSGGPLTCDVTGLTNGNSYTFTVHATTVAGNGPESAPSNAVVPRTVPGAPTGATATAGSASAMVSWVAPGSNGGSSITGYTVTAVEDNTKTCTWSVGPLTCVVSGLTNGTSYTFTVHATNVAGNGPESTPSNAVLPGDSYHAVTPVRVLDSRQAGLGPFSTPWGPNTTRDVPVAGVAGVPADADAVILNVTVTNTTAESFLSLWPTGQATPNPLVSSLNWKPQTTIANAVTAKVGTDGQIRIFNPGGHVDVVIDVVGWFGGGSGSKYNTVSPTRVLDSRATSQVGPFSTQWTASTTRDVTVAGVAGVPANADAVVLNVTATDTTAESFLSVWPSGQPTPVPLVSSLNWKAGQTIPNAVTATVGTGGQIRVFNPGGEVNVIIDVVGYYASGTGSLYVPLNPARLLDSRPASQVGSYGTPWTSGSTRVVSLAGLVGVPTTATAVISNVTVTDTTAESFLSIWPAGQATPNPLVSSLNWKAGVTIPNAVTANIGTNGQASVFNNVGSTDVVVDVSGYFL